MSGEGAMSEEEQAYQASMRDLLAALNKIRDDNKRLRTELAVALARVERAEAALTSIADWSNAPVTVARKALGIYT